MMYPHSPQAGFSFVETLVAITILLIVIVGPMSISSSAGKSTSYSSEQVIAFFLAQEGAEIAQKARDDLMLQGFAGSIANPWDDHFTDTIPTSGYYADCFTSNGNGCGLELSTTISGGMYDPTVESPVRAPVPCTGGACKLRYNDPTNDDQRRSRYTHDTNLGTETIYTRVIRFELINANEVKVTSTVTWRTGSLRAEQEVAVETYLFKVYDI